MLDNLLESLMAAESASESVIAVLAGAASGVEESQEPLASNTSVCDGIVPG